MATTTREFIQGTYVLTLRYYSIRCTSSSVAHLWMSYTLLLNCRISELPAGIQLGFFLVLVLRVDDDDGGPEGGVAGIYRESYREGHPELPQLGDPAEEHQSLEDRLLTQRDEGLPQTHLSTTRTGHVQYCDRGYVPHYYYCYCW